MIFEALYGSAKNGELILMDGGLCHFHLRLDSQVTIKEIIVLPERQGQGIGRAMLEEVIARCPTAVSIFAKCPVDLTANRWYDKMDFELEGRETTRSGRELNCWRLNLALDK